MSSIERAFDSGQSVDTTIEGYLLVQGERVFVSDTEFGDGRAIDLRVSNLPAKLSELEVMRKVGTSSCGRCKVAGQISFSGGGCCFDRVDKLMAERYVDMDESMQPIMEWVQVI